MYSRDNFLSEPVLSGTTKVFKIISDSGSLNESIILNVCHYQKSITKQNKIIIISNNFHESKILTFKTIFEAVGAHQDLIARIYQLRKNCSDIGGGSGSGGGDDYQGPISIALAFNEWDDGSDSHYLIPGAYDISKDKIDLYVNGQKLTRHIDYNVDLALRKIYLLPSSTWTITSATDRVEIIIY